MNIRVDGNPNYVCTVVKVTDLKPIEGMDRVVYTNILSSDKKNIQAFKLKFKDENTKKLIV